MEDIIKNTISNYIIDEVKEINLSEKSELISIICQDFINSRQVKKAINKIKKNEFYLESELQCDIIEELEEVLEDLQWKESKKGLYVLTINKWLDSFRDEFNTIDKYQSVYLGGHSSINCIYVTGKLPDKDRGELVQYLKVKNPPFKIKLDLKD
ncbi:hypothetical protein [Algivirga pacifica]|uniref:Uncharacterized protein n=1 Tax=Algivirga pacifica TaxID=1162670 RepID=A0ABP9CWI9_9BACT